MLCRLLCTVSVVAYRRLCLSVMLARVLLIFTPFIASYQLLHFGEARKIETPQAACILAWGVLMLVVGSAYGSRTRDLRLERAESWTTRRMRLVWCAIIITGSGVFVKGNFVQLLLRFCQELHNIKYWFGSGFFNFAWKYAIIFQVCYRMKGCSNRGIL